MKLLPVLGVLLGGLLLSGCARLSDIYTFEMFEDPPKSRPAPSSGDSSEVSSDGRTVWIKSGAKDSQRQADISNCYSYAQAQVAHDMKIQDDVGGGSSAGVGAEESAFMVRMDNFELGAQRERLFSRCMRAKGYSRS